MLLPYSKGVGPFDPVHKILGDVAVS